MKSITLHENTVIEIGKSIPIREFRKFFEETTGKEISGWEFYSWLNTQTGKTLKEATEDYCSVAERKTMEDLLSTGITVNAHEFTPQRFPTDLRFHTYMKIMVACITYDWSNVKDNNYKLRLRDAIGDWEWMDDGHVSLKEKTSWGGSA